MKKKTEWSVDHKYKNADPLDCPNKIRLLRFEKGWSSGDLGKRVGTSRDVILGYERGRLNPGWTVIGKLCEVFDVKPGDLFWRKGEQESLSKERKGE